MTERAPGGEGAQPSAEPRAHGSKKGERTEKTEGKMSRKDKGGTAIDAQKGKGGWTAK